MRKTDPAAIGNIGELERIIGDLTVRIAEMEIDLATGSSPPDQTESDQQIIQDDKEELRVLQVELSRRLSRR